MTILLRSCEVVAWVVALSWVFKVLEAWLGLVSIVDLCHESEDRAPVGMPSLAVIVPARNEEEHVAACLRSLLEQEYPNLRIIAVNDRSTDGTGRIMDELAAASPERLRVLHITELPPGWLGKTHGMSVAAELAGDAKWLLFTDADVVFRADCLRRALAYSVAEAADHLVVVPTMVIRRWDEAMLLGFLQIFGVWAARPWKMADPRAKRDAIGIGAFNMVRRGAYEQTGGFAALRMAIIEDIGLARRIKAAGFAQRIAFGPGLVSVHWASGAMGLVKVMTKNMFAAFNYRLVLAMAGCVWMIVFCIAPVTGLFFAGLRGPSVIALMAILTIYWQYGITSKISMWNALLSPLAAMLLLYALLRSMVTTWRQGGVIWRGTFYPLEELRRYAAPLL
jgi:glycosyltransferase involved in cell wall biosynthesis